MRTASRLTGAWLLAATVLGAMAAPGLGVDDPSPDDPSQAKAHARARELFRRRIQPLLQTKCLGCHGDGEELDGDLDLRSRAAMLRGGKNGPALVPGNALASLLYQAVRRSDERAMPPKERDPLSPDEIAALKNWIEAGAPWEGG